MQCRRKHKALPGNDAYGRAVSVIHSVWDVTRTIASQFGMQIIYSFARCVRYLTLSLPAA
jgi:hypothetical protein